LLVSHAVLSFELKFGDILCATGFAWFGIDHSHMAWWEMGLVMIATCAALLLWQQPFAAPK
jgi:hypothetical protein